MDEYRFDTVARSLIEEVEQGLAEDDPRRRERWRQLLRWLFDASPGARQVLSRLTTQVITVGGAVRRATTCYLGSAYPRGQIVWRLYEQFGQDEFVAAPEACGLAGVPLDKAEEFLIALGVNATPKMQPFQSGPEYDRFESAVVARMAFPRTVRDCLCNSVQDLQRLCRSYTIDRLSLPDRWFRLLTEGDSSAIAAYFLSAGGPLVVGDTDAKARFAAKIGQERALWYDSSILIPNPILHFLRESAWVTGADGKRHRPSEIMLSSHGVRVLRGVYTQHAINVRDRLIAAHGGREALEALRTRLGAVSSLESLSGTSLYDLLLSLPERDPRGALAPGIYRTLIESNVSVEDSPQRDAFLQTGKMWARHKGKDGYLPVQDLRYNANLTVTKAIEEHLPLVAIGRRMNTGLIKQLFGIASLSSEEISLRLLPDGTEYDPGSEDANEHLCQALPYIYALRLVRNLDDRGRELGLLKKAVLRVCARAQGATVLPGGRQEEILLSQPGERIVVDATLIAIGEYREGSVRSLTFWLGVAELVAELLGRDVADEVGGILRCRTPAEMLEVVQDPPALSLARNAAPALGSLYFCHPQPVNAWINGVVPSRQHGATFQPHGPPLLFTHLLPRRVRGGVQASLAMEAGGRARPADELQHHLIAHQRFSRPVPADQTEHTMLDQIPLRGPRRVTPGRPLNAGLRSVPGRRRNAPHQAWDPESGPRSPPGVLPGAHRPGPRQQRRLAGWPGCAAREEPAPLPCAHPTIVPCDRRSP